MKLLTDKPDPSVALGVLDELIAGAEARARGICTQTAWGTQLVQDPDHPEMVRLARFYTIAAPAGVSFRDWVAGLIEA